MKVVEKIKTHFKFNKFFRKSCRFRESQEGHRWQYGACALHAGYLRLQTQAQNM